MALKLKKDEKTGLAVFKDDKPVYVDDVDNKEIEVDVPKLFSKVTELNGEAKGWREKLEAVQTKFKPFEKIEDLAAWTETANKAMETVKNLDESKLVEAGKVDLLKAEMRKAHEAETLALHDSYKKKMSSNEKLLEDKDSTIYKLLVSSKFSQSPYFTGERPVTSLMPDIAESYFGKHFKVEKHNERLRVVGYLDNNPIYSRKDPGELADFEEAFGVILDAYPMKEQIIKSGGAGSGGEGGSGDKKKPGNQLEALQVQLVQALKDRNPKLAITLRGKIHELQQKVRAARAA
jgi:hypothetical protein